jgi:two-component system sensor histidine kinase KdpD
VLSFNFFFLPPVHTFTITQPQNWVALVAFLLTALTAGQLSARARQRAEEAESGRREVERLYRELQAAFERESRAEALRQAERLKSALLDGVTHDLRTPLTSIKASVTTLLGEASEKETALDPDGQRELLEVIDEEADRLNRGVEKLVELAKIEAGEMHVRRRWSDVEEIVAAALTQASRLTPAHTVEVRLEPEIPAVFVDAQAIAEVVYTLVDNATKYAPPGTCITITQTHPAEDMIEIAVEDEGPGISTELRTRVFEKFFRATNDSRIPGPRPTGLGLGLAVARGIIEAHGGRIWIEEGSQGRGTRVVFRLPIGDDDSA